MKGPGLRENLDVRRTWRCPRCSRERRAAAVVTSLTCGCAPDNPRMQLVESQRRVRPVPKPLDLVLNIDLDEPDDDSGDTSSDTVPIETDPAQSTVDDSAGRRRRDGDRQAASSRQPPPPASEDAAEAATEAAGTESAAVGQTTTEDASMDDPDEFGFGLADVPAPPVPEDRGA